MTSIIGSGHCQSEFWGGVFGAAFGLPRAPHLPLDPHIISLLGCAHTRVLVETPSWVCGKSGSGYPGFPTHSSCLAS